MSTSTIDRIVRPNSLKSCEGEGSDACSYDGLDQGGFAAPLARLIELGFMDAVKNGVVRGSEMLFLKGKVRSR